MLLYNIFNLLLPLFVCLALIPRMIRFGFQRGIIDSPGALTIHEEPTPRTGGIGIFVTYMMVVGLTVWIFRHSEFAPLSLVSVFWVLPVFIFLIGFFDDVTNLPAWLRLAGQVIAGLTVFHVGIRIELSSYLYFNLLVTAFYIIGGVNTINLIDGMDGLAAGTASVSSFFFVILSVVQNNPLTLMLSLVLLGAVLGFLPHNFPKAKIFMGDSGSLFIGFMLACIAIFLMPKPVDLMGFAVPTLVLGFPILDTLVAIIRRLITRQPIFSGDRSHIYDWMHAKGLSRTATVVACWGIQAVFGSMALVLYFVSSFD